MYRARVSARNCLSALPAMGHTLPGTLYLQPVGYKPKPPNHSAGGVLDSMHGRSRTTIETLASLTIPGRSTSGSHQPGRHCLHQARSAVSCLASRMEDELHPTKNRL